MKLKSKEKITSAEHEFVVPSVEETGRRGHGARSPENLALAERYYWRGHEIAAKTKAVLSGEELPDEDPDARGINLLSDRIKKAQSAKHEERVVLASAQRGIAMFARDGSKEKIFAEEDDVARMVFPQDAGPSTYAHVARGVMDGFTGVSSELQRGGRGYHFATAETPDLGLRITHLNGGVGGDLSLEATPLPHPPATTK